MSEPTVEAPTGGQPEQKSRSVQHREQRREAGPLVTGAERFQANRNARARGERPERTFVRGNVSEAGEPTSLAEIAGITTPLGEVAVVDAEQERAQRKQALVGRLETEYLERAQAEGKDTDAAHAEFAAQLGIIESDEEDLGKLLDAAGALETNVEEFALLLPENDPRVKKVKDLAVRTELVDQMNLGDDEREEKLELLRKIQTSDGSVPDAEIIEAVATFKADRASNEALLKELGGHEEGDRLTSLLDSIDQHQQVTTQIGETTDQTGNPAGEPGPAPHPSTDTPEPDPTADASGEGPSTDEQVHDVQQQVQEAVQARNQGREVPPDFFDKIGKEVEDLVQKVKDMSPGQRWALLGLIVLIALVGGTFASIKLHGGGGKK